MRKVSLLTISSLCIFSAGCVPHASVDTLATPRNFEQYKVEFNARSHPNSAVLETLGSNSICAPPGLGCVEFDTDTFGNITFVLQTDHSPTRNKCEDAGVKWVITKVEATDTGNANKGNGWQTQLPLWVTTSFYPIQNAATGLLYSETDVTKATSSLTFLNLNKNKAANGTKTLWYKVTASSCEPQTLPQVSVKTSDPRVENKGSN